MHRARLMSVLFILLALSLVPCGAQGGSPYPSPVTVQSAASADGNGEPYACRGYSTLSVQVSGTFSATVTFQASLDGSTWHTVQGYASSTGTASTTATAAGLWRVPIAGFVYFRAPVSSYASGTVTVVVAGANGVIVKAGGGSTDFPLASPVGLRIVSNSSTPNTKVDWSVRQAILTNGTGQSAFLGSGTINTAVVGANGLDAGTQAANTLYFLWLVGKSDGTLAGLLSTSATAPTMPSGYTYKFLASWAVSDGSNHFLAFVQDGNIWTLNDCQSIYDTNPAPVNTETTVNVNTHNTYPLCPVELTRRVGVGVQTGGSGGNRSIALYRGDALGSGPTEAYFLQHENVSAYCGWVGLDSSAQIKFIIHPGAPNDRIIIRAFAFQVEWY